MFDNYYLAKREKSPAFFTTILYTGALFVSVLISLVILLASEVPIGSLYEELFIQVFILPDGQARTLTASIPIMLVGLAATLCLKLKFWNIGIEGQMIMGAIAATLVALYTDFGFFQKPAMLISSMIFGAIWILGPLWLKTKFGVSEVIISLMASSIAYLFLQHLLFGILGDPKVNFPTSIVIDENERFFPLGLGNVHTGIFVALAFVIVCYLVFELMNFGYQLKFLNDNEVAAKSIGMRVGLITTVTVLAGGACAGFAGATVVMGTEFRLTQQIAINATFNGIVVAALAQYRIFWIPIVSIFIAGLHTASASLKVFYGVSSGTVLIIQGIVLLCLVSVPFFSEYKIEKAFYKGSNA